MTDESDRPERPYRREYVSVWRFALFVFALAGIAVLTWHEFPRLISWRDRASTKTDAGDVAIDVRMAPPGRISNLPEYVVQYFTSVGFAPGSAALTSSGRQLLDNLLDKGDTLRAYLSRSRRSPTTAEGDDRYASPRGSRRHRDRVSRAGAVGADRSHRECDRPRYVARRGRAPHARGRTAYEESAR